MNPETKKKIEEAAIKYRWSLASKEAAIVGYSLAAEEKDAEIAELKKTLAKEKMITCDFEGEIEELQLQRSKLEDKITSLESALKVAEEALGRIKENHPDPSIPSELIADEYLKTIRSMRGEDKG